MALTKISTAMISQSAAAVDLNVDAGTFYVDTTNNRVGVGGKTDPDTPLHVVGTVTATLFAGSGASLTNIPNSALTNSSITINSTATSLGGSITLTTANIAENTNLYYTNARADARIAAADTDDLSEGSSNLYYTDARVDARVSGGSLGNITTTGYIRGPATFTLDPAAHGDNSGTVVIAGNLQVDGTTTTINSTTMTVDDKNITLASGSANAGAASGAGFTVDIGSGTNPTITYDGTNDEWDFNKPLNVTGSVTASSVTSNGSVLANNLYVYDDIGHANDSDTYISFDNNTHTYYAGGTRLLDFAPGSVIFNEGGGDVDFRVEGVGAVNALFVQGSDGKVGIGTSSPSTKLHLSGADNEAVVRLENSSTGLAEGDVIGSLEFYKSDASGAGVGVSGSLKAVSGNSTGAETDLIFGTSSTARGNNAEIMRLTGDSKVGIGNPSPQEVLHVAGNIRVNNNQEFRTTDTGGSTRTIMRVNNSDQLEYGWSGAGPVKFMGGGSYTERMRIHTNANIGINDIAPHGTLTVTGPRILVQRTNDDSSIAFANNATGAPSSHVWAAGLNYSNSNAFTIAYGSGGVPSLESHKMVINTSGNVGIGTDSPDYKLEVVGNTMIGDASAVTSPGFAARQNIVSSFQHGTNGIGRGGSLYLLNTNTNRESGFLSFGAYYNNTNNLYYQTGGIGGGKETAAGSGWGGYLSFWTTSDGTAGAASGQFEHMRITADGNVGIGENNPAEKLDVAGRIKSDDGLLSNHWQLYNTGTNGFLIGTSIAANNYGHIHGEIKLQRFNANTQQIINFSATVSSIAQTVHTKAATADIDVTIKMFVYSGVWYFWVPSPSTYTDISAYIHLGNGYQGGSRSSNAITALSNAGVPSSGVTNSVDIVAQKRILANTAGNVGIGTDAPHQKLVVTDGATPYSSGYNLMQIKKNASNGNDNTSRAGLLIANNSNAFTIAYGGTTDRLRFIDGGNVEQLTILNGGNVGIGTISPQKKFHVEHTAGASEGILISGASDTAGHTAGILLRAEGGEADSALRAKAGIFLERTATYGIGKLHIANRHNSDNVSATISDANITIYDDKVGIGTTSPSNMLSVNGVITSGNFTASGISGSIGDANTAELGPGYLVLARDDTADAAQIRFGKNGAVHSYLETRTNGLGFITNVGNFAFEGGNVGIGTATPGALLDLETAGNTADGTYYSTMTINNTGSSTYSGVRFDRSGSARWRVGIMPDDKFQIAKLYNGVADDTFVINSSGNVGIGTDSPNTQLQINSATDPKIRLESNESGSKRLELWIDGGEAIGYIAADQSASQLAFKTAGTERMRITSAGKVAIGAGGAGTSGTHTKLEVHGAIAAGSAQGTGGSLVLYQRYGVNDMPATLSTHYSNSYWLLATGMKARSGASGYVSSLGNYSTAKAGIEINNSSINYLYVPAATHAVDTVLTPRSPFYMNLDTGTLEFRTTSNTLRGYISAQETNTGGTHGAGLIIATSGGENITFKDGGTSGTRNMVITGSGNVEIPNGQLILGDTDSRIGQMYIYGTGNNYLRWFGTSGNDFEIDLQGTSSTGKLAFNQLDLALSTQSSRLIVGASAGTDTLYGTTSVPAIGIFGEGAYASGGAHIEIAADADIGWSPIYINKFDWQSGDDARWIAFGVNGFGTDSGTISYDGTNFAIVNGSDYRLKENIVDYSGGLAKIEELQVRSYNKKEGVSKNITQQGFIAHEAALANIPGLVLGAKDAMKEDETGNTVPDYQTINREALIPYLVSAIQELTARVRELENS